MDVEFKELNIERDFDKCFEFRKDSYICSFGSSEGFEASIQGYKDRICSRMDSDEWFYIHLWQNNRIIGQLEFRAFSQKEGFGYIHLIYLIGASRGSGVADKAHDYIVSVLSGCGCKGVILSVSRANKRALKFYTRRGWEYLGPNPKHGSTDFRQIKFSI